MEIGSAMICNYLLKKISIEFILQFAERFPGIHWVFHIDREESSNSFFRFLAGILKHYGQFEDEKLETERFESEAFKKLFLNELVLSKVISET